MITMPYYLQCPFDNIFFNGHTKSKKCQLGSGSDRICNSLALRIGTVIQDCGSGSERKAYFRIMCLVPPSYYLTYHVPHCRDRDRETRFEMFVSNEAVGSVIGRRGAKINEIRAMSGARINVLESGTKGRGGGGRGGSPEPDRERIIGKLPPLPAVLRIRIRIFFLGLLDPDADPLVRGMDPDPSIIKQNLVRKALIPSVL
jgi:hypothetical protein